MTTPASLLDLFLLNYIPATHEQAVWGDMHLSINAYRADQLPPDQWVTSARCVVLNTTGDQVVVLRNEEGGIHVLPGGRREAGESLLATLHREIMEETGWMIHEPHLLGFIHFHHLTPEPDDYPYPYPDFLQVVYAAKVDSAHPQQTIADVYETHAAFSTIADAERLPLPVRDRLYLTAALSAM